MSFYRGGIRFPFLVSSFITNLLRGLNPLRFPILPARFLPSPGESGFFLSSSLSYLKGGFWIAAIAAIFLPSSYSPSVVVFSFSWS